MLGSKGGRKKGRGGRKERRDGRKGRGWEGGREGGGWEGGKEGEESSHMSAALKSEWSGLLKRPSIYIMYVRWTSGTNHHIQKVLENFC